MNLASFVILLIVSILLTIIVAIALIVVRASRRRSPINNSTAGTATSGFGMQIPIQIALTAGSALVAFNHRQILGWFVSDEIATNLGLWLNPVFWIGAIGALVGISQLFKLGGALSSGGTSIAQTAPKLLRPLLFVAVGGVLYLLFFTNLSVFLIDWDWGATPLGGKLDEKFGSGSNTWIWLAVGMITLSVTGRFIFPAVVMALDMLVGIILIGVVILLLLPSASAVVREKVGAPAPIGSCMSVTELNAGNSTVYTASKCFRINAKDGRFVLFSEHNTSYLEAALATSTINMNPELFRGRTIYDFLIPEELVGPTGQWFRVQPNGFRDAGIKSINVMITAKK